jgi:hypothetical protein
MDCHQRTVFLILFIMLFASGYILINKPNQIHSCQRKINQLKDIQAKIRELDRFMDVPLSLIDTAVEVKPTAAIVSSQSNIAQYDKLVSNAALANQKDNIDPVLNAYINNELETAQVRYKELNSNINDLFQQINEELLKTLDKNYSRAHNISKARVKSMNEIDDLPLRVMA